MRKLLIGLGVLAGAATALVVTGLLCVNHIIEINRDRIVGYIETELGRPVSVERITISLWSGIGVRVGNMRIGDDPRFGDADFMHARRVMVGAKLLPLLRRQFVATSIDARDPYVYLVRDAAGRWNYETLGAHRQGVPPSTSAPGPVTHVALSAARLRVRVSDASFAGTPHPTGDDQRAAGGSAAVMQHMLEGGITTEIRNGRIDQFNLVEAILERVSGLSGIGSLISGRAKPKYARLFAEPGMSFEMLRGTFRLADQRLATDDLSIVATDYAVQAHGWIGLDRHVDLSGTLVMSEQFSDDVIADVKVAKYLTNDHGQLAVPFRLRGRLGEAQPTPDATYLQAALQHATRGATQQLLENLLGRQGGALPTPAPGQRNPLEKGLRELLGR